MASEPPGQLLSEPEGVDPICPLPISPDSIPPTPTAPQKRSFSDQHNASDGPDLKRLKGQANLASSLMSLPSEIRVKILHELLFSERPLEISCEQRFTCQYYEHHEYHGRPKHKATQRYRLYPEILRVNKSLYEEGRSVLYEKNVVGVRILARNSDNGLSPYGELQVTMLDHSSVLIPEEGRQPYQGSGPFVPPDDFYNFHVHIKVEPQHNAERLELTLREVVMNLNQYFPLDKQ